MFMETVLVILIFFLIAAIHGFLGFGAAIFATILLMPLLPLKTIIPLIAIQTLFMNIYLFLKLKSHFRIEQIKPLIIGTIIGLPIGAYGFILLDIATIKMMLGILIILFVLSKNSSFIPNLKTSPIVNIFLGTLAGALGVAFNINGPPVIIYAHSQTWNAHEKKITLITYFLLSGIFVVITHAITGISNLLMIKESLLVAPFSILGAATGHHFFDKFDHSKVEKFIFFFLLIIGILFILQ
ncbi:MAG: hypothetical protein Kow00108_24250 [Calditrichia bacterium]